MQSAIIPPPSSLADDEEFAVTTIIYRAYADRNLEPVGDVSLFETPTVAHLGRVTVRSLLGRPLLFPRLLYELLHDAEVGGFASIVSWKVHGRAFQVYDRSRFESEIMPRYFRAKRYGSFERQLYLYNFALAAASGQDAGSFYHEFFLRGRPDLTFRIGRSGSSSRPEDVEMTSGGESLTLPIISTPPPDFYLYPACGCNQSTNSLITTSAQHHEACSKHSGRTSLGSAGLLCGDSNTNGIDTMMVVNAATGKESNKSNNNNGQHNIMLQRSSDSGLFARRHIGASSTSGISSSSWGPQPEQNLAILSPTKMFSFDNKSVGEVGFPCGNGAFHL